MGKIFVDVIDASIMLGTSPRHFARKYVATGLLEPIRFNRKGSPPSARARKQLFLVKDVEQLKGKELPSEKNTLHRKPRLG